jgi:uncharacterized membrane protein
LVDITERSIAQTFDNQTTTVQALHRLHDLLRHLALRQIPTGEHRRTSPRRSRPTPRASAPART